MWLASLACRHELFSNVAGCTSAYPRPAPPRSSNSCRPTRRPCWLHGFAYPIAARRAGGHHDLAFLAGGGYSPDWAVPRPASLDALVAALRTEIEAGPATTILSSENFYLLCEPTAVQDLMARLTASPAVPSRWWSTCAAQDEAALSWYNQAVKAQGYAGYFEDHMATRQGLWDYHRHLQAWAGAFGRERMVVRRYDAGDDVRRDFIGAIGIPAGDFVYPDLRANTEINRDILEFQRQINRLPLSPQEKRRFHKQLMALTAAANAEGIFYDTPLLDSPQRRKILTRYDAGNQDVARMFLGRDELFIEPAGG